MITSKTVKELWDKRWTLICICGCLFNKSEIDYLCKVLDLCNFDNYSGINCNNLCKYVKECFKEGKDCKVTASELIEKERILRCIA